MRRLQFGVFFGKTHILVVEEAEHDDRKADRHGEDLGLHRELIPYAGYGVPDLSTRLEPLAHVDPFAFFSGNAARPPTAIPSRPSRSACFPNAAFPHAMPAHLPEPGPVSRLMPVYDLTRGQTTKNRAPRPGFLSRTTLCCRDGPLLSLPH